MMITSGGNAKIKYVAQLQKKSRLRRNDGVFVVEGPKMFGELPKDRLVFGLVSESFARENQETAERYGLETVKDSVFREISDTQTPQGILAVARQLCCTEEALLDRRPAQLLILEKIQDPGNLGTMMRAGEAAGATGVLMSRDTADLYSPKVVRATMGAIFRLPAVQTENLGESLERLKKNGVRLYAAHLKGAVDYDRPDYRGDCAFLIGNEANGLTAETAERCDERIRIPMAGKAESLNAAVAASVLMFEAARQRRR